MTIPPKGCEQRALFKSEGPLTYVERKFPVQSQSRLITYGLISDMGQDLNDCEERIGVWGLGGEREGVGVEGRKIVGWRKVNGLLARKWDRGSLGSNPSPFNSEGRSETDLKIRKN